MSESANEIEIGAVRKDEMEAMLRVLCAAFQMPFEAALPVFMADTNSRRDNKRVLRVNGEIVSCLTIIPAVCRLRGVSFRTAGIAGVATRPDNQGRGYASLLLRNTLTYCRYQGYMLAGLFPVASPYYRKFGLATVSRTRTTAFSFTRDLSSTTHVPVRMAIESDLKSLESIHWESTRTKPVSLVRNASKWQNIFASTKRILVAESGGNIIGYLIYEFVLSRNISIASDTRTPLMARILEIETTADAAYTALLNYCTAYSEAEHFSIMTDQSGSVRFRTISGMAGIEEDTLAAANANEFMLMVLDLEALVGRMAAESMVTAPVAMPITLELIDTETGEERIVIGVPDQNNSFSTNQSEQARHKPFAVIAGDTATWTQILAGYYDAAEACRIRSLQSQSEEAVNFIGGLFPRSDPFVSMLDNF